MTHLTSKERTGFTAKELKTKIIAEALDKYWKENVELNETGGAKPLRITRLNLRRIICGALDITGQQHISGWINKLIELNLISPNPTSEIIPNELRNIHMPSCKTLYFINHIPIIDSIGKKVCVTPVTTLDSYNS